MSTVEPSPRVAVIDADRRVQSALAEVLRVAGADVIGTAGDIRAALELAEQTAPDVMVIDPHLPDLDAGLALISSLQLGWPSLRVVLMGWGSAGEVGIGDDADQPYVAKSAEPEEFVAATLAACSC